MYCGVSAVFCFVLFLLTLVCGSDAIDTAASFDGTIVGIVTDTVATVITDIKSSFQASYHIIVQLLSLQ